MLANCGGWWKPVAVKSPEVKQDTGYGKLVIDWVAGIVFVYDILFGLGKLILGDNRAAVMFFLVAAAAGSILYHHLSRMGWLTTLDESSYGS